MKSLKILPTILIIAVGVSLFAVFANVKLQAVIPTDLVNYYVGAEIVKNGDGNLLYDIDFNHKTQERVLSSSKVLNIAIIRLLPFGVFFLIPLTFFPILVAYKLFAIINLLILGLIIIIAKKTHPDIRMSFKLLLLISLFYFPIIKTLVLGQLSLIFVFLLILTYFFFQKKKYFIAGLVASMLSAKLQFVLFYPFLFILSKDRKKFLGGLIAGGIFLFGLSILASGTNWITEYPGYLLKTESPVYGSWLDKMWTFTGFLFSAFDFFRDHFLYAVGVNTVIYCVVLLIFAANYARQKLSFGFMSATVFSLFFSTHLYEHDLSLLLVVLFGLMNLAFMERARKRKKYVMTLLVLYFLPFATVVVGPATLSLVFFTSGLVILSGYSFPFSEKLDMHTPKP